MSPPPLRKKNVSHLFRDKREWGDVSVGELGWHLIECQPGEFHRISES
jgi:hypothetical protein